MEKITSENTNRALRDTNTDKTTVLLSPLRNNYAFIVGYCCSGADPASKFRGGNFSNIWQSSLITGSLL